MSQMKKISEAVISLLPNARFAMVDSTITVWEDDRPQPTDAEIQTEVTRLQTEYDSQEYARNRVAEYPPMEDYLDGIVKGDTAQVDKYIADCLAVKDKYPKG